MKRKILIVALLAVLCLSLTFAACQNEFTVTFETNGGSPVAAMKSSALTAIPETTKEGHYLIGWYLTPDFSGEAVKTFPYKLTKDITLYAKWGEDTSVKYIVNFVVNGGSTILADQFSTIATSPETSRAGYVFAGWYDNEELTGDPVTFPYKVSKSTVLYAKWTEQKYRVEFNSNGGSHIKSGEFSVIETAPETTYEGHTFAGWFDNEELTGDPVQFPFVVTEETTLHAKWQSNAADKFIASFQTNGGSAVADQEVSIVNQPVTTRTGYTLEGWYFTSDFSGAKAVFPYTLTKDTVFYAKWEEVVPEYGVTFVTNGGSAVNAMNTSVIQSSPATTRPGYNFAGWYDNASMSGSPVTFPYKVTKTTILYAKWSQDAVTYTLILNPNGGNRLNPLTNVTTVKLSDLPTPTYGENEFVGWYMDAAGNTPVTFPLTLTQNTTIYAKWKMKVISTFNVYFVDGGSSFTVTVDGQPIEILTDSQNRPYVTVDDHTQITVSDPTKDNALFEGWFTSPTFGGDRKTFPMEIDGNRILYAKWKINVTPDPDDSAELQGYFDKTDYVNFGAGYGLLIQNTVGTLDQSFVHYAFDTDKFNAVEYLWDNNSGKWLPAYSDWAFYRNEGEGFFMTYVDDDSGVYEYGGLRYNAEPIDNIEQAFRMVYLKNFNQLDSTKFYKYDGWWHATEDYANEAGQLVLGNSSGDPTKYDSRYTEISFRFDANGVITAINAKSTVMDTYDYGTGVGATYYYYTHTITIDNVNNYGNMPAEDDFLQDQNRPSGLYPELNPNDTIRNNVTSDGVAYSLQDLQTALESLQNFTSYYTLAGNTFSGYIYNPVTIHTRGNVGLIVTDEYKYNINGTLVDQKAEANRYFLYRPTLDAFFLTIQSGNSYLLFCDQYNYKNNYSYNQYLLGLDDAVGFNCKYPAVSLRYFDASGFTFNAKGGYFEFTGSQNKLTQLGKSLFGDMDVVYPEMGETEYYTYLRFYMNDGKLVKVLAASRLELFGESNEYFIKELVITDHENATVGELPAGFEEKCIAPGEPMTDGNVSALESAINQSKNTNHKFTDRFVYDDVDELGGIGKYGSSERDVYIHYNGITKVNENLYLYFKDGKLYRQFTGSNVAEQVGLDTVNGDVEKANSYVLWAYNMAELLDADWFYQGKDGKYYGKADSMAQLSRMIGRFSGSEQFLENDASISFGPGYRWTVEIDFVSVELSAGKLSNIYYSGVIFVKGSSGSHTKPFSGYATFSYDNTVVTLPISGTTADNVHPAVYEYINADYNFQVDNSGILHIEEVTNAADYKVTVYQTDGTTVKTTFNTTNLTVDLKTIPELGVSTSIDNYYLSVTALGNGTTVLDGKESDRVFVELSSLPKLYTPVLSLNYETATLTVAGDFDNAQGFHWKLTANGEQDQEGNVTNGNTLALGDKNLKSAKTYTISVYMRGVAGSLRDSATAQVLYTVPKTDGTSFLGDLFNAINFEQSFRASFNSSATPRGNFFNGSVSADKLFAEGSTWLKNNCQGTMSMLMYYDKATNMGKLTFVVYNDKDGTNQDENRLIDVTFRFSKQDDKLVGSFVKKSFGKVVQSSDLSLDLFFNGASALEDDMAEVSGRIDSWTGLVYQYKGNLSDSGVQQTLAGVSIYEEMFGCAFTYTGMQASVGYNSDGSLINECSISLVGEGDGKTVISKVVFSSFGQDLSTWVKD